MDMIMPRLKFDTSSIDRLDLREQIAALDEVRKPLADAVDKISAEKKWAKIDAEIEREREIYERELRERAAAFHKRCAEIRGAHGENEADPEAALEAHDQHEAYGEVLEYDENSFAVRCCVSGLVLLDGDELVEDSLGRKALAAVLPGWPVFEDDAEQDDDVGDGFGLPAGTIDAIADGTAPGAGRHLKAQGESA